MSTERPQNLELPWEGEDKLLRRLLQRARVAALLAIAFPTGLVLFAFSHAEDLQQERDTQQAIYGARVAIEAFMQGLNRCPRNLGELLHPPGDRAPFLNEIPQDAWGQELYFRCPDTKHPLGYVLLSPGPDGELNSTRSIE